MNRYVIYCRDRPGSKPKRDEAKQAHFRYVEENGSTICVAGPLKDDSGEITGSLYIINANSKRDAWAFLEADPYFVAGIWDNDTIVMEEFIAATGDWIGGPIWRTN
ncbi:YciI family protein [Alterisphingorhabdus coralli]|uniref:YciI family protein n=1 Tax=Alterisphingorhabdus coralli TaxID=3071408 RepID=A0AA97F7K4_9SPHN|nr:YciI family protein [Parasphingorhabdus sp. SCSIO 66989]WOE75391.1 YciI family protein [Parasphingorhabdus sp. SCSIO 66989]